MRMAWGVDSVLVPIASMFTATSWSAAPSIGPALTPSFAPCSRAQAEPERAALGEDGVVLRGDRDRGSLLQGSQVATTRTLSLGKSSALMRMVRSSTSARPGPLMVSGHNAWLTGPNVDAELATDALKDDHEVKLAHAGEDELPGLFVLDELEGGVFLADLGDDLEQLLFILRALWLDRETQDGVSTLDALEQDFMLRPAERVASGGMLEAGEQHDLSSDCGVDPLLVACVDIEDARDTLFLAEPATRTLSPADRVLR